MFGGVASLKWRLFSASKGGNCATGKVAVSRLSLCVLRALCTLCASV